MKTQKEKALEILRTMDIYKPYIKGFDEKDQVCFFEHYAGFWVEQEPEIYAKMQQLEKEYKCKVYAITHELTNMGEMYSFLIVTNHRSEWKGLVHTERNKHTAFAYVWNKDYEYDSEFGDVMVQSFGGGIRRIA